MRRVPFAPWTLALLLSAAVPSGSVLPATAPSGAERPGTAPPGFEQPESEQPESEQPESEQPGSEQPRSEQPRSEQPGSEQPGFAFDRYEVVIGAQERQTVVTGFLLGGALEDLAVVHIDDNADRVLRVFALDGDDWAPALEATLGREVAFVDVANVGGHDRLITYAPGRVSWFDPASATEHPLLAATSSFDPPRDDEIPHVDITRDDLVVPDADGFWIFVQGGAAELPGPGGFIDAVGFADPVKIGAAADMSRINGADGYRYDPWSQGRIHEIDYDGDGRRDLVFWNEDRFEVHLQDERGLFAAESVAFTTDVTFDSDRFSTLVAGDTSGTVLHSLTDLNDDGVADLVVFSLRGTNISSKQSGYEVHFGVRAAGAGVVFEPEVGATFQSDHRIQLGMERHDFDGDGRLDVMVTTIAVGYLERSFLKRIGHWMSGRTMSFGVMGDDIWLDLEFYRLQAGRYPDEPDATRRIAFDGAPSHTEPGWVSLEIALDGATHERRRTRDSWPKAFNRTLLIGDVSGDGRADLIIEPTHRELDVFPGVPGPGLFAEQPETVAVDVPNDEEYTWLVDLDGDGRQDILLHQPFKLRDEHGAPTRPPGTEPHRVTLLIAR